MFGLGPWDMMIVLVIAVLLFGKRLPEVAKSLGKGVTEFRKGIRGIEDEIHHSDNNSSSNRRATYEERDEPTAPKFVPPPVEEAVANAETAEKATT